MPIDLPVEGPVDQNLADGDEKKKQQRRGRKKSKLEDMFPAYLQVGLRLRVGREAPALQTVKKLVSLTSPAGSFLWEGAAGPEPKGPFCSWGGPAKFWTRNPQSQGGWRLR